MFKYLATRFALAIPTMLAVLTLVFFVVRVIPGDPATAALGDYASKEAVEALRERMGLNAPLYVQYFRFLGDLLRGNLGTSMITGKPISETVLSVLPYTLQLTLSAVFLGALFGVPIGVYTAVKRNSLADYLGRILSLAGLSVPAFYLGILIMLLFAIKFKLFPAVGGGDLHDLKDNLQHLVLPALSLGLIMTTSVSRLTRSAMLNVLSEHYVRTARSKGLEERVVIIGHALRAALVPIVSIVGIWAANLVADSVLTETVFARPGLGKMLVGAIMQRDYTALQSVMVIYTLFIVVINLLTDVVYSLVDPRITHY
ncbi:MAG: ABC transporter permease [Chloroflexi bacterium]|nr:ABC transporter permease [Chloroflexota bacterium]